MTRGRDGGGPSQVEVTTFVVSVGVRFVGVGGCELQVRELGKHFWSLVLGRATCLHEVADH